MALAAVPAAAQQHQNANAYVSWDAGGASGIIDLEQRLWVGAKAPASFWPMLWSWTTDPSGGYIGVQTDGGRFDGSSGDTAIFSLWDASAANGPSCGEFGGEGTGFSCRLAYPIYQDRHYLLRVERGAADAGGQWWGGWIIDEKTGRESWLGEIQVAGTSIEMNPPRNFSEYYGPQMPSCGEVPPSVAYWGPPGANADGAGGYQYTMSYAGNNTVAICTGGKVETNVTSLGTGARVILGGWEPPNVKTAPLAPPAGGHEKVLGWQHQYANNYVFWNFAGATGFDDIAQEVWIGAKAVASYWPMLFNWSDTPNVGGYMGLQTDGNRFDLTTGDTAIFSLWNATAAANGSCGEFGGEGTGFSCRVAYPIAQDRYYRYRLERGTSDAGGQWWDGYIRDMTTGIELQIGSLRVAASHVNLTTPYNFSEYYGQQMLSCEDVPLSLVYWKPPAGNWNGAGYDHPSTFDGNFTVARCTGGFVDAYNHQGDAGARSALGGSDPSILVFRDAFRTGAVNQWSSVVQP